MTQDDKVFEQLEKLTEIQMKSERKLAIRDELQKQMAADRRHGKRRLIIQSRLRTLAPGAVAAAAMVVAGTVIAGILTQKKTGALAPARVRLPLQQTAGAGAGGSPTMAWSSNEWFYFTMGIVLVCAVLVFLTRKWNPRWEWVRETMSVLRSPILWGAAFGIVVGIRGIPVLVPNRGYWVWDMPSSYYVASTTGFGTLGCLIGAMIQFGTRKTVSWHLSWWAFGMPALALVIGLIGFYRTQASTRDSLWVVANNGLQWDMLVAGHLSRNPSQQQVRLLGSYLVMAGADIGSLSSHWALLGTNTPFQEVGVAFHTAGTILVQSNNPQQMRTAEKFVNRTSSLYLKVSFANHDNLTAQNMAELISQIYAAIPQSWAQDYAAVSN
ncbi:sulfite exporter TauE/SafE family protein [Alicyclobacillus sp. ALC3]|uniref:sulfite exporter TauE/SafE family protein n=1 Tax=Alicyclobacillus sp. ALC3 TaxID=2796143 RepID=UPI0023794303|nr:sulfite exporter TauE/SafE family protein [Alicyclobacillus sp. ALC3]WDL95815.1 sulfite exporter TauE/SafE family protein [Alicyclobacillus sp. ALC3]